MPTNSGLEGVQPMAASVKGLIAHADSMPEPEVDVNGLYNETPASVDEIEASGKGRLAYFKTRNFYIVLVLGYVSWNAPDIIYALVSTRERTLCHSTLISYFSILQ